MPDRPALLLVVPLLPARTGNGLAMRAGMLLDALAQTADVDVVVVPVSGRTDAEASVAPARTVAAVAPADARTVRDHTVRQLADPSLRRRLEATAPLPWRAALAPPTLAGEVLAALPPAARHPGTVLVFRSYLAPLGIWLARMLGARVVVDADEDDTSVLRGLGDDAEADAFERLVSCWLPDADRVLAAAPADATALARGAQREEVRVVPNAISLPAATPSPPSEQRLLFVGNLTYEPNRLAACELTEEILPAVQKRCPEATLDIVGPAGDRTTLDPSASGVHVVGFVPDLAPWYGRADIVVAPLRHGGGTRLKVLEAFAYRRPLVATPTAVAGLEVHADREAVLADDPGTIAAGIADVLEDPHRGAAMAERAVELIQHRYTPECVFPLVRASVLGSPERSVPGPESP